MEDVHPGNHKYKRILAIKLRELGDSVLWTSSLKSIAENYPGAELHICVLDSSQDIFKNISFISKIHTIPSRGFFDVLKMMLNFRKMNFDLVLGFHGTTTMCRYGWLFGKKTEKVFHHHSWEKNPEFNTYKIEKPGFLQNSLLRDWEILKSLGLKQTSDLPVLCLTEEEKKKAIQLVAQKSFPGSASPLGKNVSVDLSDEKNAQEKENVTKNILILPGASISTKRYPLDLFKILLSEMVEEKKFKPFVVCDPGLSRDSKLYELCGELSIALLDDLSMRELIAVISCFELALCSDSAPKHIAVALGLRTLTLFGPSCIGDWQPYDKKRHPNLRESLDCRLEGPRDRDEFQYCTLRECSHLSCLRNIRPDKIKTELEMLL